MTIFFLQSLKSQIKEDEEKLEKLLDGYLQGFISKEEYIAQKQKLLNQKMETEEKLRNFEKIGNRWLELCKNFILTSNQAKIVAFERKFGRKTRIFKKNLLQLRFVGPKYKTFSTRRVENVLFRAMEEVRNCLKYSL